MRSVRIVFLVLVALVATCTCGRPVRLDRRRTDGLIHGGLNATVECLRVSENIVECDEVEYFLEGEESRYTPDEGLFWAFLGISTFLVLFAGLASGLTLGLLTLDTTTLLVLKNGGTPEEKKHATKILPLVENRHLLLVTLLLANALSLESLPIFLDRITSPIVAILISVTLVLLFGEIIPQALCARWGLAIGARLDWMVKLLIYIMFPVGYPLSKLLDFILGIDHGTYYRRSELKELVNMHGISNGENDDPLTMDEIKIIRGVLDLSMKTVKDAMIPFEDVFWIGVDAEVNHELYERVLQKGHSRIPVYDLSRRKVVGIVLVKDLIPLGLDSNIPVTRILRPVTVFTQANARLFRLLDEFQTGKSHLAVVNPQPDVDEPMGVSGIITLEDIIEEILQEEIVDETDEYVDVHRRIRVARQGHDRPSFIMNRTSLSEAHHALPRPSLTIARIPVSEETKVEVAAIRRNLAQAPGSPNQARRRLGLAGADDDNNDANTEARRVDASEESILSDRSRLLEEGVGDDGGTDQS